MERTKNLSKPVCMAVLICAFIYGLVLPFCWGNNPASEFGTLSVLCSDKKGWFALWGALTSGGVFINSQYMFRKFGIKSKLCNVLGVLAMVSMVFVTLSLGHSIEDWNPKRIIHWVTTGFFIAFTAASIALYFLINIKKHKSFKMLAVSVFCILSTFFILFVIIGKGAVMEMIPIALLEVFLFVVNFTSLVKDRDAVQSLV